MNDDDRDPMDIVTDPDEITRGMTPPDGSPPQTPPPIVVVQPAPTGGGGRGKGGGKGEPKKTPLQQALPNPERVKIERRRADGHKSYIGHYSWAEVQRYRSFELFLQEKIVSRWKGGEYELSYVRADGTEEPRGVVVMEDPPGSEPTQVTPLDQVLRLAKQLKDEAAREAPPPVDPISQLQQLLAVQKQMGGGSDGMMTSMLMMQLMGRQEPKPDPMESTLRMVEAMKAMQPPPQPISLPPMPSGPDPMLTMLLEQQRNSQTMMIEQMKMQAEQTRVLVESMRHQEKGPTLSEILHLSQSMTPKDGIGARDILPMISTMKDLVRPPEKDGLREHLEAFRLMRQELKELSDDNRPSGFRELAESVLPKGVESITELIQAIRTKEASAAQALSQPLAGAPGPQTAQLPPGFKEHAQNITKSKDAVEAMGATLTAFMYLGQSPDYLPALEQLIRHARGGEKEQALDLIQGFLEGIGRAGLITAQSANYAMEGFDEHWDDVVNHLLGGTAPPAPKPKAVPPKPPMQRRPMTVAGHAGQQEPTQATVIPIGQPVSPIPGQPITPPAPDGTTPPGTVS
jgi:hypothetical protein